MNGISAFTGRARDWFFVRLGIASLVVIVPIAIASFVVFGQFRADRSDLLVERTNVVHMREFEALSDSLLNFRSAVLNGDRRTDAIARSIDAQLRRIDGIERRGSPDAIASWNRVHAAWTIARSHRSVDRANHLVELGDAAIADRINEMLLAGDRNPAVRIFVGLEASELPLLRAQTTQLSGDLGHVLASRSLSFKERVQQAALLTQVKSIVLSITDAFANAGRAEPLIRDASTNDIRHLQDAVYPYASTVERIVEYDDLTPRSVQIATLRNRQASVDAITATIVGHIADRTDLILQRRIAIWKRYMLLARVIMVFACALGAWFIFRFAQDMRRRAEQIAALERAEQERRGEQVRAHNAERALAASSTMFRTIFERAPLGIATIDSAGGILDWNAEIERFLDHRRDAFVVENRSELLDVLERRLSSLEFERSFIRADGTLKWAHILIAPYSRDGDRLAICMLQDITERKDAELRLQHEATHDGLTGLANRKYFRTQLSDAIELGTRKSDDQHGNFAIFFIDLDLFKFVNDTYGHAAGDVVLTTVAERLRTLVSAKDVVARFGGDEFAILVMSPCSLTQGERLAQAICTNLALPIKWEEHNVNIGSSVGLAFGPGRYTQAEDLMRNADTAMYAAKSAGRGRYVVFDPTMQDAAHQRAQLSTDLQRALGDDDQVHLLFQPIVGLEHNEIMGFEALVRWKHPLFGDIPPEEFVKVAEQSGAIRSLGRYVMRQACSQLMAMSERLPSTSRLTLSVNISPSELAAPDFVESVAAVIRSTDFDPERLYLEITESSMIVSGEQANRIMSRLREFGIRISIDDFGAGYSSLRYLQELKIDLLKIDRGFLSGSSSESSGRTILRAIVNLASSFDLPVVAEGVETPEQLRLVRSLGCQYAQGMLWGRPMSLLEIEARLSGRLPAI